MLKIYTSSCIFDIMQKPEIFGNLKEVQAVGIGNEILGGDLEEKS